MSELDNQLFSPATARQLKTFISQPAHGLLLTGKDGAGKRFTAKLLAAELLGIPMERLDLNPYFIKISKQDDKSEISIDAARQLIRKLSLKVAATNRDNKINRVAVIEDAGYMSTEAQNAVLKLLEEPPDGTLIILTADSESLLLPTVISRAQKIIVRPVLLEASLSFYGTSVKRADIETAWRLSQGAPALMHALLSQSSSHPLKKAVDQAKELLKLNAYERIIYLQPLSKDKPGFQTFLEALAKVLSALQEVNIKSGRERNSAKLLQARKLVNKMIESSETNTNSRLIALSLAVNAPL